VCVSCIFTICLCAVSGSSSRRSGGFGCTSPHPVGGLFCPWYSPAVQRYKCSAVQCSAVQCSSLHCSIHSDVQCSSAVAVQCMERKRGIQCVKIFFYSMGAYWGVWERLPQWAIGVALISAWLCCQQCWGGKPLTSDIKYFLLCLRYLILNT
jgi:hypothetical protein